MCTAAVTYIFCVARSQAHASRRIVSIAQWPGVSSVMIVMHAAGVLVDD